MQANTLLFQDDITRSYKIVWARCVIESNKLSKDQDKEEVAKQTEEDWDTGKKKNNLNHGR